MYALVLPVYTGVSKGVSIGVSKGVYKFYYLFIIIITHVVGIKVHTPIFKLN